MKKPLSKRQQLMTIVSYQLLHFLIKENALSSYIENITNCPKMDNYNFLSLPNSISYAFSTAFIWSDTPQGLYYWNNLNHKWREELNKEYK